MSWNRKNTGNDPSGKPGRGDASFGRRVRIHIATFLIVVAAVGIWVWRHGTGPAEAVSAGRSERVRPAAETPRKVEKARPAAVVQTNRTVRKALTPEERAFAETNGLTKLQVQRWKIDRMPPAGYTNRSSQTETPPEYQIFKHASENEIAALLTLTPGETLVGSPSYERWFPRDFQKSLREPIEITEDDTPEQIALKKEMMAVKADLQARMAEGEDIAEIMRETREEYQKLAAYKQTIWDALREARRDPELTDEDIELFLEHANRKLEEKGIAPITLGPVTRHMLRLRKDIHQ